MLINAGIGVATCALLLALAPSASVGMGSIFDIFRGKKETPPTPPPLEPEVAPEPFKIELPEIPSVTGIQEVVAREEIKIPFPKGYVVDATASYWMGAKAKDMLDTTLQKAAGVSELTTSATFILKTTGKIISSTQEQINKQIDQAVQVFEGLTDVVNTMKNIAKELKAKLAEKLGKGQLEQPPIPEFSVQTIAGLLWKVLEFAVASVATVKPRLTHFSDISLPFVLPQYNKEDGAIGFMITEAKANVHGVYKFVGASVGGSAETALITKEGTLLLTFASSKFKLMGKIAWDEAHQDYDFLMTECEAGLVGITFEVDPGTKGYNIISHSIQAAETLIQPLKGIAATLTRMVVCTASRVIINFSLHAMQKTAKTVGDVFKKLSGVILPNGMRLK